MLVCFILSGLCADRVYLGFVPSLFINKTMLLNEAGLPQGVFT
jgi:hypothetical protein